MFFHSQHFGDKILAISTLEMAIFVLMFKQMPKKIKNFKKKQSLFGNGRYLMD
jgi:hypothetical protein